MDAFAEFKPKLVYAEQGDKTIGRKPDESQNMDASKLVDLHDFAQRQKKLLTPRKRT